MNPHPDYGVLPSLAYLCAGLAGGFLVLVMILLGRKKS